MGQHASVENASEDQHAEAHRRLRARFAELAGSEAATVTREKMSLQFAAPGADALGSLLFDSACRLRQDDKFEGLDLATYQLVIGSILGIDAAHLPSQEGETAVDSANLFAFDVFSDGQSEISPEGLKSLLTHATVLAQLASDLSDLVLLSDVDTAVTILHTSIAGEKINVSRKQFDLWIAEHCPDLLNGLRKWVERKALEAQAEGGKSEVQLAGFHVPEKVLAEVTPDQSILSRETAWVLTSILPHKYKGSDHWALLYNSAKYGLSANRFKHHCLRYHGPLFILVRDTRGYTFGLTIDEELRESDHFLGGDLCRVFTLSPNAQVSKRPAKVWFNTKTRHKQHGIGAGAKPDSRDDADLWINEDFAHGVARFFPWVAPGHYEEFDIATVEVWGCGDLRLTELQAQELKREDHFHEKRQQAQRPGRWEDNVDRMLLEMAGVTRESSVASDDR